MIDPDELAEQAIKNIEEDRNKADYLVTQILTDIQAGKTTLRQGRSNANLTFKTCRNC